MTPDQVDKLELPCEVMVRATATYRSADCQRMEVTMLSINGLTAGTWVHAEDVLPIPEEKPEAKP